MKLSPRISETEWEIMRIIWSKGTASAGDDYVATPAGPNLDVDKGVRRKGSTLQLGLTTYEIDGVRDRLKSLLKDIDRGRIKTF